MNERRIKRLEAQIKARAAEVVTQEMADPRKGLITITRVKLDRELTQCKIYWSVFGDEKARVLNERMLHHAALFVQHEVAEVLHTRTAPRVKFVFDESIEGAIRVQDIIDKLRDEREAREDSAESASEGPAEDQPEDQAEAAASEE